MMNNIHFELLRRILFIVLGLSPFISLSQFQNDTGNELHAFVRSRPVFQLPNDVLNDAAPYANYNLTDDFAPQNEPSVRICRVNPDIVVGAWRDFRLGYLEPNIIRRIGYAYSFDGGMTWSPSQLLPDPNPAHTSQSDPVVTSDAQGHFYITSTSRQPLPNYNREMLLYKSVDSGQTFQLHSIAAPGTGLAGEDKEWIFCDPVETNPTYDRLMMVWRSFGTNYGIKFRVSDVGGANWSGTVNVSDAQSGQGANIATGTNGNIYVVWRDNGIYFDVSYDGGQTFGIDRKISNYVVENNNTFPYICVDYTNLPSRGNIYLTWADARLGNDDIWFQRSFDGGLTWMPNPVRVNSYTGYDQYWPTIQCTPSGRLVIIYYDEHESPGIMNTYLAYSDDQGNSWNSFRLNELSFNGNMPNSDVRFGDYISVDAYGDKIIPVWTDDRAGSYNQEIYSAVVDIQVKIEDHTIPSQIARLHQNFPNPFNDETRISCYLSRPGNSEINITNILGNYAFNVHSGFLPEGQHYFELKEQLPVGVYICTLRHEEHYESIIMSRLR